MQKIIILALLSVAVFGWGALSGNDEESSTSTSTSTSSSSGSNKKVTIRVDRGWLTESSGKFFMELCNMQNKCETQSFVPIVQGKTYEFNNYEDLQSIKIHTESSNGACFDQLTYNGKTVKIDDRFQDDCLDVDYPDSRSFTFVVQEPYKCNTGRGSGCKSCVSKLLRKSNEHCATCNDGYYEENGKCVAHSCSTTTCGSCVDQSLRTSDKDCASCNAGFYLTGRTCKPYVCTPSQGNGCATCLVSSARTGATGTHCSSCNDSYELNSGNCVKKADKPKPVSTPITINPVNPVVVTSSTTVKTSAITTTEENKMFGMSYLMLGAIGGGVILIITLSIVACCCCCKDDKPQMMMAQHYPTQQPVMIKRQPGVQQARY